MSPTSIEGKNADEWCEQGNSLASLGRYQEALECLEKALRIDPSHALAWFNMGLTLMNMKRGGKAREAFKTFLKHAPADAQAVHVPTARTYIEMLAARAPIGVVDIERGQCWFCGIRPADPTAAFEITMHRDVPFEGTAQSVLRASDTGLVPRCAECKSIHRSEKWISRGSLIVAPIIGVAGCALGGVVADAWGSPWPFWIIVGVAVVGIYAGSILCVHRLQKAGNTKPESSAISDFPWVQQMKESGWKLGHEGIGERQFV